MENTNTYSYDGEPMELGELTPPETFSFDIVGKDREVDGKIWRGGWGNTEAKLMIVISNPNFEDNEAHMLLGGAEGLQELEQALDAAGLTKDDIWVTACVKHGLGSKSKPTTEQFERGRAQLEWEIANVKPKLIMTMGAEAYKRIMKTNAKVGNFLGEISDSPYGKVLATHSVGLIFGVDPTLRGEFRDHFELAAKYLSNGLNYTPYEYILVDDPEVNADILESYMLRDMWDIGYDGEWLIGKYDEDEVLVTFQYSCEPHKAIILDISKDGKTENRALLDSMKPYLEDIRCKRMGWNIRVDDKRLKIRGINPLDETLAFDGMKAVAFFDSRWSKGLDTGIKKFTNYERYYVPFYTALKEHKIANEDLAQLKYIDPNLFYKYCAGDAVAHYTACMEMKRQMIENMPVSTRDYYFDVYLPLSHYLLDMEMHGIPIDVPLMEKLTNTYTTRYDQLLVRLREQIAEYGITEFNPNSSPDKKALLYDVLKLDPPYYTKAGKAPKPRVWYQKQKEKTKALYSPSSNGKSISSLKFELEILLQEKPDPELTRAYEVLRTLLRLNRTGVFAGKFFNKRGTEFVDDISQDDWEDETPLKQSYWNALHKDNRIHSNFFECLNNFRSSSRVNVQNPASKVLAHTADTFADSGLEPPENIRRIFYSGHPDWYYVEVDVAGADLMIAAYLSKDPDYIKDMLMGNFHVKKMREYFRNDKLGKDDVSRYVASKSLTFRIAYTSELSAAAIPIQAEIFAESGYYIPLSEIDYALHTWERYKTYMRFREQCKSMVDDEQYITNARGFKYLFEKTSNFGVIAGYKNESLAYPIASELALFMWDVSIKIKKELVGAGIWNKWCYPVNTVHDANYWIIHKDLMDDNYFPEMAKAYFTDRVRIATGDAMGMEMVVSDRWKGSQKIFSKETVWDFKTKTWNWKK